MELYLKKECVVSLLNNILEACFTKKEIYDFFNDDIVGEYGYGYLYDEQEIFYNVNGDKYDLNYFFEKLFIEHINPILILNECDWNINIKKISEKKLQRIWQNELKFCNDNLLKKEA